MVSKAITLMLFLFIVESHTCAQQIEYAGVEPTADEQRTINKYLATEIAFYKPIYTVDTGLVIPIVICSRKSEFDSLKSKRISHVNGFYRDKTKTIYVLRNKHWLKTIAHEMNHYFVHRISQTTPMWLNEGLSEFFERTNPKLPGLVCMLSENDIKNIKKNKLRTQTMFEWDKKQWQEKDLVRSKKQSPRYLSLLITYNLIQGKKQSVIFDLMSKERTPAETLALLRSEMDCKQNIERCFKRKLTASK